MKTLRRLIPVLTIVLATSFFLTSCDKDEDTDPTPENLPSKTIAEIASDDPNFSILVDALSKAGLVDVLNSPGTYTVFAPTNDAFEMLFNDLGVSGIDDLSAEALTPILLYHVVGATAKSTDLATGYFESLSAATEDSKGIVLYVEVDGGVTINSNVQVTTADIIATNGVIHVVNKVLLPPTVVDIAIQNPAFSILVEAVVKTGLVEALSAAGPFTVFAPTNAAFEALFADLQVGGIEDLAAETLTPILLYHVVSGNILAEELSNGSVPTLNENANIDVTVSDSGVTLNGSTSVIAADVQAANGVVHAIDSVLLP
jgi:transforming growth factor-beta-induced protein